MLRAHVLTQTQSSAAVLSDFLLSALFVTEQCLVVTVVKWLPYVSEVWSNPSSRTGRDGTKIAAASIFSLRRITFRKQLNFLKWESRSCPLRNYCHDLVMADVNIKRTFSFSLFCVYQSYRIIALHCQMAKCTVALNIRISRPSRNTHHLKMWERKPAECICLIIYCVVCVSCGPAILTASS